MTDLEIIKGNIKRVRESEETGYENCKRINEAEEAAERMAAEIEREYKKNESLTIRFTSEIARLKAELASRPEVTWCDDCSKSKYCGLRQKHKWYCADGVKKESEGER